MICTNTVHVHLIWKQQKHSPIQLTAQGEPPHRFERYSNMEPPILILKKDSSIIK